MGFFTNLNLDGQIPVRTRPRVGEEQWAPAAVPTTKRKKVQRVLAPIAFGVALTVLVGVGYYFFRILVVGG
ncbi:hypothetical protein U6X29_07650 [Cutibacterium acnes]|nr:hypothetical protein AK827_02235 [Cutibacterium acnes]KPG67930.1 hypothetical protein AK828_01270 [Cutibacterium acnes]PZA02876.1 hypothetical protein Asn12ST33_10830 [Cutibacterium acnes]WGH39642.1 hypothetical protein OYC57_001174 [Cutibacterium acnes]HAP97569.1 hypothetical protein [Cutibacterium acnes]